LKSLPTPTPPQPAKLIAGEIVVSKIQGRSVGLTRGDFNTTSVKRRVADTFFEPSKELTQTWVTPKPTTYLWPRPKNFELGSTYENCQKSRKKPSEYWLDGFSFR